VSIFKKASSVIAISALILAACVAGANAQNGAPPTTPPPGTPAQLQQLVAPIALYPDALVAQILAASTYTDQVVDANRYLASNPELKGKDLALAVNAQDWDPSVKALTQFPSVLSNMVTNLAWTTSLGEAYANNPSGVMQAVQELRKQAKAAGKLKSTKEQTVTTQGSTIVIQPASPGVVYVPYYNPTVVYGAPFVVYPGYVFVPPPYYTPAAVVVYSPPVPLVVVTGATWGWSYWNCNWHTSTVVYNSHTYYTNSSTVVYHNNYNGNTSVTHTNYNTGATQKYYNNGNTAVYHNSANGNTAVAHNGTVYTGNTNNYTPPDNRPNNNPNTNSNNLGSSNTSHTQTSPNSVKPASQASGSTSSSLGSSKNSYNPSSNNQYRGYGQGNMSQQQRQPGAFDGYGQGGMAQRDSNRGRSSWGGGGGGRGRGR
jgi:hypothetical protein